MLYDKLKKNKRIPFHMPGHKRNTKLLGNKLPYDIDITEINGFDNLHSPEGVIKEIEEKARKIYQSKSSFILVNGSTGGILAGVNTVVKRGDSVLIARNCHKSVYNALELARAKVHYISSEVDEYGIFKPINPYIVKCKIEELFPKLLILTSPTYEGVCSDIESICEIAHSYNIPVILDAAHGAHMLELGSSADIVIMSLHKTLPALTQCAVAHINGDLVDPVDFRIKLSVFETSSPSYILMASIDKCLSLIDDSNDFRNRTAKFILKRDELFENLSKLQNLKAVQYDDVYKLIIYKGNSNISGIELSEKLRNEYNIESEMACRDYILLILTECDDFNTYNNLEKALFLIDKSLKYANNNSSFFYELPEKAEEAYKVYSDKAVCLSDSVEKVCAEYVWAYPPGIPIIVPGEIISEQLIENIKDYINCGVNIQSTYSMLPEKIFCQV